MRIVIIFILLMVLFVVWSVTYIAGQNREASEDEEQISDLYHWKEQKKNDTK